MSFPLADIGEGIAKVEVLKWYDLYPFTIQKHCKVQVLTRCFSQALQGDIIVFTSLPFKCVAKVKKLTKYYLVSFTKGARQIFLTI